MKNELAPLKMASRSLEWHHRVGKEIDRKLESKSPADRLWALQTLRRHFFREKQAADRFIDALSATADHHDLAVRQAAADLFGTGDRMADGEQEIWAPKIVPLFEDARFTTIFGLEWIRYSPFISLKCGMSLVAARNPPGKRLDGIRLLQLTLGDMGSKKSIGTLWEGYSSRHELPSKKLPVLPAQPTPKNWRHVSERPRRFRSRACPHPRHAQLRRCRTAYAHVGPLQAGFRSSEDIHYLAVYARLSGKRGEKEAKLVARALLDLDQKVITRKLNRDSNWPLRLQELYAA